MMLLAIQDANRIPSGTDAAECRSLSPGEHYQNKWGWGCAESGCGCTRAFNQHRWWDYNAFLEVSLPESSDLIFKAALLTSSSSKGALPGLLCCTSLRSVAAAGPALTTPPPPLLMTNDAHTLLLLLLLPLLSASLPPCWSIFLSHSDAKVTALCFPLHSLSIAVAAVADSCVTQAPEKPESPTRKVEAPDPSLSPTDPCPPGSSILLPACNGGLQVTYLSTPLWAMKG